MKRFSRKVLILCICNSLAILFFTFYLHRSVKEHTYDDTSNNIEVFESLRLFAKSLENTELRLCLIEPRLLWDATNETQKLLLRSKGYEERRKNHHKNHVITLAILEDDVKKLVEVVRKSTFSSVGFKTIVLQSKAHSAMEESRFRSPPVVSHLLFLRRGITLHVVVFYSRKNYFWCAKMTLAASHERGIFRGMTFGSSEAAFDKFNLTPYVDEGRQMKGVYLPSNIPTFLAQIGSSRFIRCLANSSTTPSSNTSNSDRVPGWLFEETASIIVEKMKEITGSTLTEFWLASGTLLGWYRDCGLIPYTHDVDFSAWARDINEDLIAKFKSGELIGMINALGKPSEDLELWLYYKWLRVDLFFTYYDNTAGNYYVGGHRPERGYSFRYVFPNFTLCSGDFLGYKVLVPCHPEKILESEYGKGWLVPEESWNYEMSPRNIKGRRYWTPEEIEQFQNFSVTWTKR